MLKYSWKMQFGILQFYNKHLSVAALIPVKVKPLTVHYLQGTNQPNIVMRNWECRHLHAKINSDFVVFFNSCRVLSAYQMLHFIFAKFVDVKIQRRKKNLWKNYKKCCCSCSILSIIKSALCVLKYSQIRILWGLFFFGWFLHGLKYLINGTKCY